MRCLRFVFVVCIVSISAWAAKAKDEPKKELPRDSKSLFEPTKVWTIHIKFTAEQWNAMEPKRAPRAGGPFGRPNDGRSGTRAAELLAPVVMSLADADRDGELTSRELVTLGNRWFQAWDKETTGKLSEKQFTAGMNTVLSPVGGGMNLVGAEGKRNGIASVFGIEYEFAHADLEFEGQTIKDVAIRCKGNGTFLELGDNPKRSFKVDLDKYLKGNKLAGVTSFNLQNNITDVSWMNEILAYRLFRDAQVPAPRTAYAKVFITVAGKFNRQYYGLYTLSENVDQHFAETQLGTTQRGTFFKPVTPSLFADHGADWAAYNQMYDPKTKPNDAQKKAVTDLCRLVTQADDKEFNSRIGDMIDIPEFARYMAVLVYLSDLDGILGPGQNLYLFLHPETKKFVFIPWDQDHSWGQFDRASRDQRNKLSIHQPWQGDKRFFERIFQVESFKKAYLGHLGEFSKSIFSPERIAQQVDEIATVLRPIVKEEPVPLLERFELAVAGKMIPPVRRGMFNIGEIMPIKPFAQVRLQSITDQLAGKSEGLKLGGGFGMPGRTSGRSELGSVVSTPLYRLLASEKQTALTQAEVTQGLERLFQAWDTEKKGKLGFVPVKAGIEKSFTR